MSSRDEQSQHRSLNYKGHHRGIAAGSLSFLTPLFTFYIFMPSMSSSSFNLLFRCQFCHAARFFLLPAGIMNHMAWHWLAGALSPLTCPRSHVRLMYQSPRDSFALWLEQSTIHPNDGGLHHRTDMHSFSGSRTHTHTHERPRTWIAKVIQQSHQLCHKASVCLCPQLCFLMWSRSLSSNPFPLNTARSQPYFLISLFSLPCDSRMKLPSSSTRPFVSTLLNSAGAVTLAHFQMTKVTRRFRRTEVETW